MTREERLKDEHEEAERGHAVEVVPQNRHRADPIRGVETDVDLERSCGVESANTDTGMSDRAPHEAEGCSPRSGTVWKEMPGTRARWMTCTNGVTCALRMSAASWNSDRFRVSSSYVNGIVITRSVSLGTSTRRYSKSGVATEGRTEGRKSALR